MKEKWIFLVQQKKKMVVEEKSWRAESHHNSKLFLNKGFKNSLAEKNPPVQTHCSITFYTLLVKKNDTNIIFYSFES